MPFQVSIISKPTTDMQPNVSLNEFALNTDAPSNYILQGNLDGTLASTRYQ